MTIEEFVETHKVEIDAAIRYLCGHTSSYVAAMKGLDTLDNEEREEWVLNDEVLYNWARAKGVEDI